MADHVTTCPDCRNEAAEWRQILAGVDQALWQASDEHCIDENDLAEYLDGVVGGIKRMRIEHHLAGCRRCVRSLVALYDLVNADAPGSRVKSFAVEWMQGKLTLLQDSLKELRPIQLTPLPVLRAADAEPAAVACVADLHDGRLAITVLRHETGLYSCTVEYDSEASPLSAVVSLVVGDSLIESRPLPDDGTLTFRNIEPGNYLLRLERIVERTDLAFSIRDATKSS